MAKTTEAAKKLDAARTDLLYALQRAEAVLREWAPAVDTEVQSNPKGSALRWDGDKLIFTMSDDGNLAQGPLLDGRWGIEQYRTAAGLIEELRKAIVLALAELEKEAVATTRAAQLCRQAIDLIRPPVLPEGAESV